MTNDQIKKYLVNDLNESLGYLNPHLQNDSLLNRLYQNFESFDFEAYKQNISNEIIFNCEDWWVNPDKGIIPHEKLYSILFEYSISRWSDIEAVSYGISKWEDRKSFADYFDMGYNYDFATEFYAVPGFSLSYFKCLEILDDDSNLDKKYRDSNYFDIDGFDELFRYIKNKGALKIHDVFMQLCNEGVFEKINCLNEFLFIFGEHDSQTIPILIK